MRILTTKAKTGQNQNVIFVTPRPVSDEMNPIWRFTSQKDE